MKKYDVTGDTTYGVDGKVSFLLILMYMNFKSTLSLVRISGDNIPY